MADSFRPVNRDQPFFLPPDMGDWLPPGHLVWFLLDTLEEMDSTVFHARHPTRVSQGRAGYDPHMMVGLLFYGYARGAVLAADRAVVCDMWRSGWCVLGISRISTIARFRSEHQEAFAALFGQVLVVCEGRSG